MCQIKKWIVGIDLGLVLFSIYINYQEEEENNRLIKFEGEEKYGQEIK